MLLFALVIANLLRCHKESHLVGHARRLVPETHHAASCLVRVATDGSEGGCRSRCGSRCGRFSGALCLRVEVVLEISTGKLVLVGRARIAVSRATGTVGWTDGGKGGRSGRGGECKGAIPRAIVDGNVRDKRRQPHHGSSKIYEASAIPVDT